MVITYQTVGNYCPAYERLEKNRSSWLKRTFHISKIIFFFQSHFFQLSLAKVALFSSSELPFKARLDEEAEYSVVGESL